MTVTIRYLDPPGETVRELQPGKSIVVGRDQSSDLVVPHSEVSRHHLRLTASDEAVLVEDLQSSNGTFLNQRRILCEQIGSSSTLRLGESGPEISIQIARPEQTDRFKAGALGGAAVQTDPSAIQTTSRYSQEQLTAALDPGRQESGPPAPPASKDSPKASREAASVPPPPAVRRGPAIAETRLYLPGEELPKELADQLLDTGGRPIAGMPPASTRLVNPEELGIGLARPAKSPPAATAGVSRSAAAPAAPAARPGPGPATDRMRHPPLGDAVLRRQLGRLRALLFGLSGAVLILMATLAASLYRLHDRAARAEQRLDRMDAQMSELLKWLGQQKARARGEISGALEASKTEFQRQFNAELAATRAEFEQRVQSMRQEFEQARAGIERDLSGVKSLRQTAQAETKAGTQARAAAQEATASVVLVYTSYVLSSGDEVAQWQTASGFFLANGTKLVTTKMAVQPWKFLDPDMLATMQSGGYKVVDARTNIVLMRHGETLVRVAGEDQLDTARQTVTSQRGRVKVAYLPRDDWSSVTGESSDGQKLSVQVHRTESPWNFAVLEVAADPASRPAEVRKSSLVGALGAKFTVLGFAGGITGNRAQAVPDVVSLRQRDQVLELDKAVGQPQLGSPVLDPSGQVVAMVVSGNYCIPIDQILPYVSRRSS